MTGEQKTIFFDRLVKCGFKEIEVSYPSASETDFGFTRKLIENGMIPDDVWIQARSLFHIPSSIDCLTENAYTHHRCSLLLARILFGGHSKLLLEQETL